MQMFDACYGALCLIPCNDRCGVVMTRLLVMTVLSPSYQACVVPLVKYLVKGNQVSPSGPGCPNGHHAWREM